MDARLHGWEPFLSTDARYIRILDQDERYVRHELVRIKACKNGSTRWILWNETRQLVLSVHPTRHVARRVLNALSPEASDS